MNTERFWELIEITAAASTEKERLELFQHELEQLSAAELMAFARLLGERLAEAYNWDLWFVVWLSQGGWCSDDRFHDFRLWLISRGRDLYESTLKDPESIAQRVHEGRSLGFELFGYVPKQVYRQRTGAEDWPESAPAHPKQPSGGEWLRAELKDRSRSKLLNLCVVFNELRADDYAVIEQRFPRLWAFGLEKGIIKLQDPNAPPEPAPAPSPIDAAIASVDPELMKTDINAYLKSLSDAVRKANAERRQKEGS